MPRVTRVTMSGGIRAFATRKTVEQPPPEARRQRHGQPGQRRGPALAAECAHGERGDHAAEHEDRAD
jgi:hypothetical protein